MTPEEKIEALREWANIDFGGELTAAQKYVRDIIDSPKPTQECCTDGTCDDCAPLFAWAEYRKDYEPNETVQASKAFRAGWDAARKTEHIDPPKPKWREIADRWSWTALHIPTEQDALASILYSLGGICAGKVDADWLGKIIAICEAQVGDGWQADPDREPDAIPSVDLLLNLLVTVNRWQFTANAAAKWLRSLTDGGAA